MVGGGPAGMMAALLLARAGVAVTVLERHDDFLRDFRGDDIHPSTLELLHELGLLERFLERPHTKAPVIGLRVGGRTRDLIDFRRLRSVCRFLVVMPQWDFLDFLVQHASCYPGFELRMGTSATGLLVDDDRVVGVRARCGDEDIELHSDLVIAADGRHSSTRTEAELPITTLDTTIDVLWYRIPKGDEATGTTLGYLDAAQLMLSIDRGDYYQCGAIIPKGGFATIRRGGLDAFRARIAATAPVLRDGVGAITDWEQVRLLDVQVNRLRRWHRPGLLCIGDAAHAMSPAGGVGINYAIQDAVAAANLLAVKLRDGTIAVDDLAAVRRRRHRPTALMQTIQQWQARILVPADGRTDHRLDRARLLMVAAALPPVRHLLGRLVGLGFRREHIGQIGQIGMR